VVSLVEIFAFSFPFAFAFCLSDREGIWSVKPAQIIRLHQYAEHKMWPVAMDAV